MKPRYTLSRRAFWISFALAWALIVAIVAMALLGEPQAAALAGIAIPSMVGLIAAMLGIHRFAGALDFRASAGAIESGDEP